MKHLALLLFPVLALAADQAEPRILRRYGADATAPIVDATLSWLRAQQRDDGSWPGDPPAATTALALLAHVVHSDLPGDGTEAGAAVERGFGFLLADLDPGTGRFRSAAADPLVQPLGALAFAEATGMTHDPRLAAAAAAALRALAAGRRPDGVWNADPLDPAPGGTGDVFATVWCVLALRASTTWRCDELPSAELQEVLKRALEALEALAGPDSPRAPAGGVWPDPAVAAAAFVLAEGGRCNSPVRVRMGEALAPVRVDLARPEKSVVPSRAWDSPPRDCFFLANADRQGAHPYVFPEWNKHMLGNLPDVRGWERSADGVRDACFTALSLMVYYAWTPSGLTWCPGAHDPPPPPQRIRLRAKAPAGVLPRHVRNDYSLDGPVHVPDECAADAPFTIKDALDRAFRHEKAFAESGTYPTMLFRSVVRGEDGDGAFWTVRYEGNRNGEWPDIELRVRPSGEIRETVSKSDFSIGRLSAWYLLAYCEAAGIDLGVVTEFRPAPKDPESDEEPPEPEGPPDVIDMKASEHFPDNVHGLVCWTNAPIRVTDTVLFRAETNRFARLAAQADRIVVRDGGYTCHSKNVDEQPVLATITNAAEIAAFNDSLRFYRRYPYMSNCMCCGYPGIDWWAGDRKIILSNVQHCQALRWNGFSGDMPLVDESAAKLEDWLTGHGVRVR